MIIDLHVHSKYSFDSLSKPKDIIRAARKRGLNGIAITDHDTIRGGIETRKANTHENFLVIVGTEIATEMGDIVGLFLERDIESRNSLEVIEEIRSQGGIAVLPHPYKGHTLTDEVVSKVDAIEIYNSRTSEEGNRKAIALAERHKKPIVAGSDAHFCSEIGRCKVILSSTDVKGEIINGKLELEIISSPLYLQSLSQMVKSIKVGEVRRIPNHLVSFIMSMTERRK